MDQFKKIDEMANSDEGNEEELINQNCAYMEKFLKTFKGYDTDHLSKATQEAVNQVKNLMKEFGETESQTKQAAKHKVKSGTGPKTRKQKVKNTVVKSENHSESEESEDSEPSEEESSSEEEDGSSD